MESEASQTFRTTIGEEVAASGTRSNIPIIEDVDVLYGIVATHDPASLEIRLTQETEGSNGSQSMSDESSSSTSSSFVRPKRKCTKRAKLKSRKKFRSQIKTFTTIEEGEKLLLQCKAEKKKAIEDGFPHSHTNYKTPHNYIRKITVRLEEIKRK